MTTRFLPPISARWLCALLIFGLALTTRGLGLGQFLTADEPRWMEWSSWFISGLLWDDFECESLEAGRATIGHGWDCTLSGNTAGVTTMWLGSLGLLTHYAVAGQTDLRHFLTANTENNLALIAAMQWPFALLQALFLLAFYLLLSDLIETQIAFLATLLLTLSPYHIALSRVVQNDALTTAFMTLALLSMIGYWWKQWPHYWLFLAALMAGFAILSKPLGWFSLPFAAIMGWSNLGYRWQQGHPLPTLMGQLMLEGTVLAVGVLLTFLTFPALWTIPQEVLETILFAAANNSSEGHLQYFWGEVTTNPGWLFYPFGLLLNLTPLESVGLLGLLAFGATHRRQRPLSPTLLTFGLYFILFWLFISLSSKKQLRFLLPTWPIIEVGAAYGLWWLWQQLFLFLKPHRFLKPVRFKNLPYRFITFTLLICLLQGGLIWQNYPYYFTYYNPLLGGAPQAAKFTTVGWGEGMDAAARYLNQQPQAAQLRVASIGASATFRPFFSGKTVGGSSNAKALNSDYMVYYLNLWQRLDERPEYQPVWNYLQRHYQPVHTVQLQGLEYALIYRNPIEHHLQLETPRLQLFGYRWTTPTQLTLFWQPLETNLQLRASLTSTNWIDCPVKTEFSPQQETILENDCTFPQPPADHFYVGLADGSTLEIPLNN